MAGPAFVVARLGIYLVWAACFFVSIGTSSTVLLLVCALLALVAAAGDAGVVFSPLVGRAGFQLARFWVPTFAIALLTVLIGWLSPKFGADNEQLTIVLAGLAVVVAGLTGVRSQRLLREW